MRLPLDRNYTGRSSSRGHHHNMQSFQWRDVSKQQKERLWKYEHHLPITIAECTQNRSSTGSLNRKRTGIPDKTPHYTSIYQAFLKEVKWLKRAHKSIHTPKANAPLKTEQNTKLFSRLCIICFNARTQWWSSVQKLHKEPQQNKSLLNKTTFLYNVNMIGKRQK